MPNMQGTGVNCPVCKAPGTKVLETKDFKDRTKRRRACVCGACWWTKEIVDKPTLRTNSTLLIDLDLLSNESTVEDFTPIPAKKLPSSPVQLEEIPPPVKEPSIFDRAAALFCRLWRERHGSDYVPNFHETQEFGRFLQKVPREALHNLPGAIEDYLKDEWSRKERGHSLSWFAKSGWFNKYRTRGPSAVSPIRQFREEPKKSPQSRGWEKPNVANGHPTHVGDLMAAWMEKEK
jgi:hypothetical protein